MRESFKSDTSYKDNINNQIFILRNAQTQPIWISFTIKWPFLTRMTIAGKKTSHNIEHSKSCLFIYSSGCCSMVRINNWPSLSIDLVKSWILLISKYQSLGCIYNSHSIQNSFKFAWNFDTDFLLLTRRFLKTNLSVILLGHIDVLYWSVSFSC